MSTVDREHVDRRRNRAAVLPAEAETLAPRRSAESVHPLAELQRQVGNEALGRMLAIQRHSLNPEEEAGA